MGVDAVITGDLVKSRRINDADIETVIKSLKDTFGEINRELLNGKGTFEIFRGDSFQGLIPQPELALLVAIIIRARLRTYTPSFSLATHTKTDKPILYAYSDARIAIGVGAIRYNAERITESQGEAFQNSGNSFDALSKENERLAIATPWENINSESWLHISLQILFSSLLYG